MSHCAIFLLLGLLLRPTLANVLRTACAKGDKAPHQRVRTTDRLRKLRAEMAQQKFDAFFVPSTDPHLNEYIGPEFARRKWISGFSGSQGDAIVLHDSAALNVDSRYVIQANLEMDCNWVLLHGRPSVWRYLKLQAATLGRYNRRIGIDTTVVSGRTMEVLRKFVEGPSFNGSLVPVAKNLIDQIWTDRPRQARNLLFVHPIKFAGETWQKKVERVRSKITSTRANAFLVTKLDEIAWLFNLRGGAIPYNPVFYSYAMIQKNSVSLFVKNRNSQSSIIDLHLNSNASNSCPAGQICVRFLDYDADFPSYLDQLSKDADLKLWLSESGTNAFLMNKLKTKIVARSESPIYHMKVVKNAQEAQNFQRCTAVDSAAYVEFMDNLFKAMEAGRPHTELSAALKLEEIRRRYSGYRGPSFQTISSSGPNAAINHYAASNLTDRALSRTEIYLLDAGSQFLGCTTDVTRTVHFGTPSQKMIDAYTRVLAGFIDVARSVWPSHVPNRVLSYNARRSLWMGGLDYRHGTGHGLGTFLGVHEFPNGLMGGKVLGSYPLREGNFQSCEPGYYEDGRFGIRLETVLGVKPANTKYRWKNIKHYTFFPVALVPFERRLTDASILSDKQIAWLNAYHQQCLKTVGGILRSVGRTEAMDWLEERTRPYPLFGSSAGTAMLNVGLVLVNSFLVHRVLS